MPLLLLVENMQQSVVILRIYLFIYLFIVSWTEKSHSKNMASRDGTYLTRQPYILRSRSADKQNIAAHELHHLLHIITESHNSSVFSICVPSSSLITSKLYGALNLENLISLKLKSFRSILVSFLNNPVLSEKKFNVYLIHTYESLCLLQNILNYLILFLFFFFFQFLRTAVVSADRVYFHTVVSSLHMYLYPI